MMLCPSVVMAMHESGMTDDSMQVSGVVVDAAGQPVVGAFVLEKGTSNATMTDLDGKFSINVPVGGILEVSSIGYVTQEVSVTGNVNISVTLETDNQLLDEVVVVGYGTQKKVNLTGAVSVIKADDLKDRSALSASKMLQGSVPGLNITNRSGRPGQSATVNIRGLNSINGGSPLILIDGVEGDLERVNPADIESISVIKDASSAAIYGAAGSFGVILVTTKVGADQDGKPVVRYSGRGGFTSPTTSTSFETRGYYSVYLNNLFYSSYAGVPYAPYSDEDMMELWIRKDDKTENPTRPWIVVTNKNGRDVYNYYANTDWYHHIFNDIKPTTSHSISFSGGTKKVQYMISGSYNLETGTFRVNPDKFSKYNLRSKLSFDVTNWLNISNNTSFYSSNYDYPGQAGINNSFRKSMLHALASYERTAHPYPCDSDRAHPSQIRQYYYDYPQKSPTFAGYKGGTHKTRPL
jgi:TonB-linked SusC/RagA family outer membrane protein